MRKQIIIYNDALNDDGVELENIINNFDDLFIYDSILCIADLGLWYGRRQGQKHFKNLYDAIQSCAYDYNKLYFDKKNTTLKMSATHHDGVNYYKFYKVINNKKYAIKFNDLIEG